MVLFGWFLSVLLLLFWFEGFFRAQISHMHTHGTETGQPCFCTAGLLSAASSTQTIFTSHSASLLELKALHKIILDIPLFLANLQGEKRVLG